MKEIKVKIIDPIGLHARPASLIVQEASKYKSEIKIIDGEKTGNLKSIMNIMAMGIKTNTTITISATGVDEDAAIEAIIATMKINKLI